jgi:transposase
MAARYDKLAASCLAFVQLASIRLWCALDESTPWF